MNTIEQLEERIAQLTELVNTGTETLGSLKETLKTVEKERDRLADQRREQEPKFERNFGGYYYYICENGAMETGYSYDGNHMMDSHQFESNNYFHTNKRAQEVADKINFLLKLERLHDTFCPDYVPNFDDYSYKYMIYCDHNDKIYKVMSCYSAEYRTLAYFPSEEIAQKVCDVLNAKLEGKI